MGSGRLKENTMTSSNAGALVRGKPGGGAGGASLRSQSTGPIRSGFQSAVGAAGGSLLSGAGAERKPGEVVLMSKKYRRGTRAVDPMPESRVIDTKKYGSAMKAQRQNAEDEFMNTLMTSMERGRPKKESKEETVRLFNADIVPPDCVADHLVLPLLLRVLPSSRSATGDRSAPREPQRSATDCRRQGFHAVHVGQHTNGAVWIGGA